MVVAAGLVEVVTVAPGHQLQRGRGQRRGWGLQRYLWDLDLGSLLLLWKGELQQPGCENVMECWRERERGKGRGRGRKREREKWREREKERKVGGGGKR